MWPDVKAENMPLPHIAPEFVKWHGCIFHTKDKLCELHESGLKPLEGKLAIHDMEDGGLKRTIVYNWISERGANVMEQFNPDAAKLIREMIPYVNNRTILD